jgi:anthranilate synthase component II
MVLLLDNYDSFTYNLAHVITEVLDAPFDIIRNDQITVEECEKYDTIILSPGPGIPDEAGILKPLIAAYKDSKNIFGVCLGCQAIGEVYGGTLENLDTVYHGVESPMSVTDESELLFEGIEKVFPAGRYHSWVISRENFPEELDITCVEGHDQIMAIRDPKSSVCGVQFHPESILTPSGKIMIENFLKASGEIK